MEGNPLFSLSQDEVVRGIGLRLRSRTGDFAGDFRDLSASARFMACSAANRAAEKISSRLGLGDRDLGECLEYRNRSCGSSIGDLDRLRRGSAGDGERLRRATSFPFRRPANIKKSTEIL